MKSMCCNKCRQDTCEECFEIYHRDHNQNGIPTDLHQAVNYLWDYLNEKFPNHRILGMIRENIGVSDYIIYYQLQYFKSKIDK